jgi:hypothetical protein
MVAGLVLISLLPAQGVPHWIIRITSKLENELLRLECNDFRLGADHVENYYGDSKTASWITSIRK